MTAKKLALAVALCAATMFAAAGAESRTLRWARSGDALTLDPHAQNEGPTHTLNHHIYEPLVMRDRKGALVPGLATSW
jgi:peptide/nickel transport system substrate-binding protein